MQIIVLKFFCAFQYLLPKKMREWLQTYFALEFQQLIFLLFIFCILLNNFNDFIKFTFPY
jgi:hypothetical protein